MSISENNLKRLFTDEFCEAKFIRNEIDVLAVVKENAGILNQFSKLKDILIIGTGGSLNGITAGLSFIGNKSKTNFHFLGNTLSLKLIDKVKNKLKNKNFGIITISKSGNTVEVVKTFSLFYDLLKTNLKTKSKSLSKNVIYIGENNESKLSNFVKKNKLLHIPIDKDVPGRFSTFTEVGLIPFYLFGFDIKKMIKLRKHLPADLIKDIIAYTELKIKNKKITNNIFSLNDERLNNLVDFAIQISNETEGKNQNAIYSSKIIYPRNLHSDEQYLEGGKNMFMETAFIYSNIKPKNEFEILNNNITNAVIKVHEKRFKVFKITFTDFNEENFTRLLTFIELSSSVNALNINAFPFNQPGVENYKKMLMKLEKENE